ncbi:MAG: PilZ domain-containing protein, partial [Candidatus Sulfotelmatobacter sp.]
SPPDIRTEGAAATGTANSIADKRQSARYRCQGSARLRELGSGVSTWATFTDISLHGCYVEAMSTFRVGAKVGLTLEVNGFRLESNGEVRVVYPNLGMGICFTTMADPDRERLRELLRSLSRPSVILGTRPEVDATLIPEPTALAPITNPAAALQAVMNFFEERHILSREEFLRILRKSQSAAK